MFKKVNVICLFQYVTQWGMYKKATQEPTLTTLHLALNASNIGFWEWNAKTGHLYLSDSLMEDWGIDSDTFCHTLEECLLRIHAEDRDFVWAKIQESTFEQKPYDVEYRVIKPSGEEIWIHAKGRFFLNKNSEPERLTGITINITSQALARKKLETSEELTRLAKLEADRANNLKSAFLANMSHEIRTPLGVILGFADILRTSDMNPDERNYYLDVISKNGKALIKIIDDILDLSKIEAGKLDIEYSPLCLSELTRDVLAMFMDRANGKGIHLTFDDTRLPRFKINSDVVRIRQVIVNLVGNAIKFTSQGSVNVHGHFEYTDENTVKIFIFVTDTGIGMTPSQSEKLFRPFTQGDNRSTRRYGGTGLGLALSKRLGKALGGDVSLEKCFEGEGCSFKFEISASKALETESAVSQPQIRDANPQKLRLRGLKVLVVDDSPDNRRLIECYLRREGAEINEAVDGVQAVKMALDREYDVVLMDIQMPIMDGYEALAKLKAENYRRPIIALTAHAMKEERVRAIAAGFSDHVVKPLDANELTQRLQLLLR